MLARIRPREVKTTDHRHSLVDTARERDAVSVRRTTLQASQSATAERKSRTRADTSSLGYIGYIVAGTSSFKRISPIRTPFDSNDLAARCVTRRATLKGRLRSQLLQDAAVPRGEDVRPTPSCCGEANGRRRLAAAAAPSERTRRARVERMRVRRQLEHPTLPLEHLRAGRQGSCVNESCGGTSMATRCSGCGATCSKHASS